LQTISLGITVALLLAGLAIASLTTRYGLLLRRWLALEIMVRDLVSLYWLLFALIAGRGPPHRRWLADTPTVGVAQRIADSIAVHAGAVANGSRSPQVSG
jgi:hypothetical protein